MVITNDYKWHTPYILTARSTVYLGVPLRLHWTNCCGVIRTDNPARRSVRPETLPRLRSIHYVSLHPIIICAEPPYVVVQSMRANQHRLPGRMERGVHQPCPSARCAIRTPLYRKEQFLDAPRGVCATVCVMSDCDGRDPSLLFVMRRESRQRFASQSE